jgi:uncharacterized protein
MLRRCINRRVTRGLGCLAVLAAAGAGVVGCGGSKSGTTSTTQTTSKTGSAFVRSQVPATGGDTSATKKARGEAVLAMIHARRASGSRPTPHLAGFDESDVATFTHEVDNDVASFWQSQFNGSGYTYTPATEELLTKPAPPVETGCSGPPWTTNTGNAMYCGADNTIYLPTGFLGMMDHQFGDAALAVVIAHENGHHIQELLGILQKKATGQLYTIQTELQADCLAGVWMSSEFQRSHIQPGDMQHALTTFNDAGDPNGSSPTAPNAHGSGRQRVAAFMQGYNSGRGGQCEVPALPSSES